MNTEMALLSLLVGWAIGVTLLVWMCRRELMAIFREPVCAFPILIVESDDWGAGPVKPQARALSRLGNVLLKYNDYTGRHPVVTLALILATPDGLAIRREMRYGRHLLDDTMFSPVVAAINCGRVAGIFSLQLHGLEHFWPDTLMVSMDPSVQAWLRDESPPATESLPSPLQSRWVDASTLPTRPHSADKIEAAVAGETDLFERLFGQRAMVVVPPTFVWTREVEQAWVRHGVHTVITPGRRYTCRDETGKPGCAEGPFLNGMSGAGVTYLVRDDYFEPERGHTAEQALRALDRKWSQGRPCLLETHRANFIGDSAVAERSFTEIDRLYAEALFRFPSLRFVSCEELGVAFRDGSAVLIESRWGMRVAAWVERARALPRFWKLARLTGLAWLMEGAAWFGRAS